MDETEDYDTKNVYIFIHQYYNTPCYNKHNAASNYLYTDSKLFYLQVSRGADCHAIRSDPCKS